MYSYPAIPENAEFFQNENGSVSKPVIIHKWEWSTGFNRWGALVTFESGWRGFTWPVLK